jgi:hypothetical protein
MGDSFTLLYLMQNLVSMGLEHMASIQISSAILKTTVSNLRKEVNIVDINTEEITVELLQSGIARG